MNNIVVLLYIFNYISMLYVLLLLIPNKNLSLFYVIKYLKFIDFYLLFLFILFNIIGLPFLFNFFIKLYIFYFNFFLFNVNIFFFIFLINIVIIFLYSQFFYIRPYSTSNIIFKNYFYKFVVVNFKSNIIYFIFFNNIISIFMKYLILIVISCLKFEKFLKILSVSHYLNLNKIYIAGLIKLSVHHWLEHRSEKVLLSVFV